MNTHLARNIVEGVAGKIEERRTVNDWDADQLRWVARSLDSLDPRTADQARQQAIDWQTWASEQSLSMLEVADWESHFEALAERFPELAEEFRENGIIGGNANEGELSQDVPLLCPVEDLGIIENGTCNVCGYEPDGKGEPTEPTKTPYRVTLDGRDYFTAGADADEAVGEAVAMAKVDGHTFSVAVIEKVETDDALERYANPIETVTTVIVPAEVWVQVERGADLSESRVTKVSVLPREGDAGYFGPRSVVWEGPPIDLSNEGEFWSAMAEHLENQNLPDGEFIATWEG